MVEELDIENRKCLLSEADVNYYTDAVTKTDIKVLTEDENFNYSGCKGILSDVLVRTQVTKFKKIKFGEKEENIGYGDVNLPEEEIQTRSLILNFSDDTKGGEVLKQMNQYSIGKALNGTGNLIRYIAPLFLLCDPRDLGISERVNDPHFNCPAIYIYDKYPGGTGLAENLSDRMDLLLNTALDALNRCPCKTGCPSCVGYVGNKFETFKLLSAVTATG